MRKARSVRVETHVLGELQENAYLVFAQATAHAGEAPLPGKTTTGAGEDAVFAQATAHAGEAGIAVAIDPGDEPERLIERLEQTGARLLAILLTHGHWDHIGGVRELKAAFDAPVYLHEADAALYARVVEQAALFGFHAERQPPLDHTVKHGEMLDFGPLRFEVIHTPGHSPGGVCYRLRSAGGIPNATAKPGVRRESDIGETCDAGERPNARRKSDADAQPDVVFVGDTIFAGGIGRTDLPGGSFEQLMASIRERILTLDDRTVLYPGHGPRTTVGAERTTNPFLT